MLKSKSFIAASIIRIFLLFVQFPSWMSSIGLRSLFSHPIYSLKHLREGFFLQSFGKSFASAYIPQDNIFCLPPLFMALLRPISTLNDHTQKIIFLCLIYLLDVFVAKCLVDIARLVVLNQEDEAEEEDIMDEKIRPKQAWIFGLGERSGIVTQPMMIAIEEIPVLVGLVYYCNPFVIVSGALFQNFQNLIFLLYLLPLRVAESGNVPLATFWVAIATSLELYSIVYLVPVVILAGRKTGDYRRVILGTLMFFATWMTSLVVLNSLLVGGWWIHYHRYLDIVEPSLSTYWYFSMQMFDRFRTFYTVLIIGLPYIFVFPLTFRLHQYPIEFATILLLVNYAFSPNQTITFISFLYANIFMSPRTISRMRFAFLSILCLFVTIPLFAFFCWLWLETGSGNPNFLYFQCLLSNFFVISTTIDFVNATVMRDKARRITRHAVKANKD